MRPAVGGLGITGRPPSDAPLGSALLEVPGLKLRAPLLAGYFLTVATHWGNSQGIGGSTTDATIFQATLTSLTPARWGFYAWGAIYAYQGLGAFYALVPHGYGTNGVKERLVRVAGACWPFGWTCLLVWQWCFSQYRMIAAWLFLQGVFAANAVAMMKVWHFAHMATAIQRWAYITPSCMLAAWATLLSATFCLIIGSRKTGSLPVALAPLLAAAVTGLGLCVLWIPLVTYPLAPPMVPYAMTLAFGLGAIAASQATQGMVWAAAASLVLVVALLGSALAVTVNFSIARTKIAAGEDAESTPLVVGARAAVAQAAVSYDRLEAALLGENSGASLDGAAYGYGAASARDSTASLHAAAAAAPYRQAAAASAAARERRSRRAGAPSPPGLPRPKGGGGGGGGRASESERERDVAPRRSARRSNGGGSSVESSPSKELRELGGGRGAVGDVAVQVVLPQPDLAVATRRDLYAAERKLRETVDGAAAAAAAEWRDAQAAAAQAQAEWEAARSAAAAAAEDEAAAAAAAAERGAARAATTAAQRERAAAKLAAHAAEAEWRDAADVAAAAAATLQRATAKAGYARAGAADAAKPRRVAGTAPFYRGGAGSSEWQSASLQHDVDDGGADEDEDDAAAAEEEYRRAAEAAAAAEREWRVARAAAAAAASDSEAAESDAAAGRRRDSARRRL